MARTLGDAVLIVTGGSSGIGAATAVACAQAGMDVVLHGRKESQLARVADQIRGSGRRAAIVAGDVAAPGMSARLLDTALDQFGRFDVVFANAGYGFKKPSHELEMDELRRIFEVNFFAASELLCEAARRLIATQRRGHLLMCSSAVAKFTFRDFAAYSATKAAQNHFCRAMRMELRPYGIEVASVHPITTLTDFFERSAAYVGRRSGTRRGVFQKRGVFVQTPERVARAVVRCLRRPRPEVWTSHLVRIGAGVVTMFPSLMDWIGRWARPEPPDQ